MSPLRRITEAQRTAIAARARRRLRRRARARSTRRRSSRTRSRALPRAASTEIVGVVLAPHYAAARSASTSNGSGRDADDDSVVARPAGVARLPGGPRCAPRLASLPRATGSCSPRTRCPSGCSRATRTPTSCESRRGDRRARRARRRTGRSRGSRAGRTPEPWRGPDILEVIDDLAARRVDGVLVCPQGFTADHLEVLYDLDVVAATRADERRPRVRPHRDAQRRPRRCSTALAARGASVDAVNTRRRGRRRHHRAGRRVRAAPTATGSVDRRPRGSRRFGGKVRTSPFAGRPVDEGADAFLARVPWGLDLCRELGIDDDARVARRAAAYVWWRRRAAPLPAGLVLGVPTDLDALGRSGIVTRAGRRSGRRLRRSRPTTTCPSARSCAPNSATRCSSGWSTRCSAASTPATPTT